MTRPQSKVRDESDRPTRVGGGTTFSGGEPTARGRAAAQSLLDVHAQLRQQMKAVRDLAGEVTTGNVELAAAQAMLAEMSIRQNNWPLGAHCARYCTFVAQHHYGEDVEIFPHLRRRDETLVPILDRLADEHEIIDQLLDDLDQALTALVSGEPEAPSLQETVEVLSNALLSHLAYEEQELLIPMARHF